MAGRERVRDRERATETERKGGWGDEIWRDVPWSGRNFRRSSRHGRPGSRWPVSVCVCACVCGCGCGCGCGCTLLKVFNKSMSSTHTNCVRMGNPSASFASSTPLPSLTIPPPPPLPPAPSTPARLALVTVIPVPLVTCTCTMGRIYVCFSCIHACVGLVVSCHVPVSSFVRRIVWIMCLYLTGLRKNMLLTNRRARLAQCKVGVQTHWCHDATLASR